MVTLKPEKWVHGGYTIAHENGHVYFIKGAIPGEEVECEIIKEKTDHSFAIVKSIIVKSDNRIKNKCSSFPFCGGCSFLHISYDEENKLKLELLRSELENKNINFPEIKFHFANPENYRNNVQLKIRNGKVGFYKDKSDDIIPLPKTGCLNLAEEINQFLITKKDKIPKDGKLRYSDKIYFYGNKDTEFNILNKKVLVPKNGFFQINNFLIEKWVLEIKELIVDKEDFILELFSGSGLISIFLSDKCTKLLGLEMDSLSVNYAKNNSKNYPHLKFEKWDLFKNEITEEYANSKIWIANPPRAGLGDLIFKKISEVLPKTFIYSSCNYNTLVRDLYKFQELGYIITFIEIFDFFPRTPYFETLVKLELSN